MRERGYRCRVRRNACALAVREALRNLLRDAPRETPEMFRERERRDEP